MKAFLTLTCSLALLCLAVVSVTIAADVPQLINVQGKLTDAGGDPVADGPYSVLFSIYDVVTGGTALWQETRTVTVSDGLFSISLGESTTIPPSLFDNTDMWLGIKVETDPDEMAPRQRLTTSPYAFRAAGSSVGGWVDDGAVVRLETNTDSVGIGTASPSARLHVVESNGTAVQAFSNGGTGAAAGLYAYSDTWHAVLGINSNSNAAIMGRNDGTGPGVKGQNQSTGPAITGYASSGNLLELYNTPGPNLRFLISNDGYVQADSTIESTSGGFKFPDGSVQTTAAAAVGGGWVDDGAVVRLESSGDKVGIGTSSPSGQLGVETGRRYAGYFTSDSSSEATEVIHAEFTATGEYDAKAVRGVCVPADYYGYGGYFVGGFKGVHAQVYPTGSDYYYGIYGFVYGGSGTNYGVYGWATGTGTNWAGYFSGNVNVTGTLSKASGSFKIDHPLDPENKLLYHSFVESPDMMNVYNGNVVTDANGDAVVQLPDYFSSLNKDFRYQLTVIGQFAQAIVSEKINGNQFSIKTDKPNVEVSWQVTGIRQDAFAEANRIQVEVDKPANEVGKYLHPEAFGLDESRGVDFERNAAKADHKLKGGKE